jgi:prepilin-type N-terminal cleavage/methylation domain-containing protein
MTIPGYQHGDSAVGFTLVELVLVMVIVGVLTGIALPHIDLQRYRADTAMQGIGTVLLASQRLAVTRQHDVIVRFDARGRAVVVHEDADNDQTLDAGERERRVPLGDEVVFARGVAPAHPMEADVIGFSHVVRGLPAVTFHRNGAASEAAGFYLTTRRAVNGNDHPDDTRFVQIDRATGRSSWLRYGNAGWQRGF